MEIISFTETGSTVANKVEKKTSKIYWTEDTEDAIRDFLNLDVVFLERKLDKYLIERGELDESIDDGYIAEMEYKIQKAYSPEIQAKKEKIFKEKIEKPLYRLVENIIFTYKLFSHDVDVKTLQKLCVTHLYFKFANFDPDNGSKSFSYYGTVAKHYLQNRKKDLDDLKSVNLSWDDHSEEAERQEVYDLENIENKEEIYELFDFIQNQMDKEIASNPQLNEDDIRVINAILKIMENPEEYEEGNYSKQSIRHAIAEETKLESRKITYSMATIKNIYNARRYEFYRNKEE